MSQKQTLLLINALNKNYHLKLITKTESFYLEGYNLTANMLFDCKQLLNKANIIKPDEINIITGPGSFTSTRVSLLAAKTLSLLWNIPLKTATMMECLKIKPEYNNCFLLIDTGSIKKMFYNMKNNESALVNINEIDFSQPWLSNIPSETLQNILQTNINQNDRIPMPNLLDLLPYACANKEHNPDPQPYYSIQPIYLKTETEITDSQKRELNNLK